MYIPFVRMHADVKLPERKNPSDAGADVYFYSPDKKLCVIEPGENMLCATGLKTHIPHGYAFIAMNRSGMASKQNLRVGACVIDPGYENELFIDLHNDGNVPQKVEHDHRIAQLLLVPVIPFVPFAVESEEKLFEKPLYISNRKTGGFGSTGS